MDIKYFFVAQLGVALNIRSKIRNEYMTILRKIRAALIPQENYYYYDNDIDNYYDYYDSNDNSNK